MEMIYIHEMHLANDILLLQYNLINTSMYVLYHFYNVNFENVFN